MNLKDPYGLYTLNGNGAGTGTGNGPGTIGNLSDQREHIFLILSLYYIYPVPLWQPLSANQLTITSNYADVLCRNQSNVF